MPSSCDPLRPIGAAQKQTWRRDPEAHFQSFQIFQRQSSFKFKTCMTKVPCLSKPKLRWMP